MKTLRRIADPFILAGFATNLFNGLLNPLYISEILGRLDPRVISLGSFVSSAFPVFLGFLLENGRLFGALFKILPTLMLVEIVLTALLFFTAARDIAMYYILGMFIFGIFSTSIMYLLQRVKDLRFKTQRAAWDRRAATADALGYLAGSLFITIHYIQVDSPAYIALASLIQTAVVYALFLASYLDVRRKKSASGGRPLSRPPDDGEVPGAARGDGGPGQGASSQAATRETAFFHPR